MLFSHDGIHDSQTHLASPSYFYEQLRCECAFASRSGKPLGLIKVVFTNPECEQVRAHDILHFSYELTQLTRREECIGRLGVNEVVIIVRDGDQNAQLLLQRLLEATSLSVNHSLHISMAIIFSHIDEDPLTLLERLDRQELLTK